MLVRELFTQLSYGELNNLAMSSKGDGTINDKHHGRIISFINSGMQQLYQRFVIRENTVLINQVEHISVYHLSKRFALSSGSEELVKYIVDLDGEPFDEDEVIRVLEVADSLGRARPLNQPDKPLSVYLPSPLRVQVPFPVANQGLYVTYQAKALPLGHSGMAKDEYLNQVIDIPAMFHEALQNYIASQVYLFMNGQENRLYGQEYFSKFELLVDQIKEDNLVNYTPDAPSTKFYDRGFF